MRLVKIQIRWACRLEHLSHGYYDALSRRYHKKETVARTLASVSDDELRHGVMFGQAYWNEYAKKLMTAPWVICGKVLAFSQIAVPLRWKLMIAGHLEGLAVSQMDRELRAKQSTPYSVIVSKIKTDEERHRDSLLSLT